MGHVPERSNLGVTGPAMTTTSLGAWAEAQALLHLQNHGLQLLQQNWRGGGGELDLVMLESDTVVFVEVRYRKHLGWGGALASIDSRKQQRLINAAHHFLQLHPIYADAACRFDVVTLQGQSQRATLDWLRNAFDS